WRELAGNNSVTFAPDGAVGTVNQQNVFTHGVEVGLARNETHDLQTAADELVQSLRQSNPRLGRASRYEPTTMGSRSALATTLSKGADAPGRDGRLVLAATERGAGPFFYRVGVPPAAEYGVYEGVFRRVVESIQFGR